MFKKREPPKTRRTRHDVSQNVANLLYLVTIVCFILALRFLSSPTHGAARATGSARVGMAIAIVVTLAADERASCDWRIVRRRRDRRGVRASSARAR